MQNEISGGCHCGGVNFKITTQPKSSFLCFCDNCRKLNGGARLAGLVCDESALQTSGQTTIYSYQGGKADIAAHFCKTCGTTVFAIPKAYPGIAVIRMGTLEDPNAFPPERNTYADQACAWEVLKD